MKSLFCTQFEHFLPILGQTKIFWKTGVCHVLLLLNFYCYAKFQKKLIIQFQQKLVTEEQTNGQA